MRGIDTRRLQIFLGHRSIHSTTIYTDLAEHATDSLGRPSCYADFFIASSAAHSSKYWKS